MLALLPSKESANSTASKKFLLALIILFLSGNMYSQLGFTEIDLGVLSTSNMFYNHAKWVDINNDENLDIFYSYNGTMGFYENDGIGGFTLKPLGTGGISIAWGDIDNDGDLDFITDEELYTNDGSGDFSGTVIPALAPYRVSGLDLADADNDGDLDLGCILAVSGSDAYFGTILYNDEGVFRHSINKFPSSNYSNCAWVDLNQDDHMDFMIHSRGWGQSPRPELDSTWLYVNENQTFNRIDALVIPSTYLTFELSMNDIDNDFDMDIMASGHIIKNEYPSFSITLTEDIGTANVIETGDVDNDGFVDIFCIHNSSAGQLYLNDGFGEFTSSGLTFPTLKNGNGDWADYDDNGDLDFVVLSNAPDGTLSIKIFRNDLNTINTKPNPPTLLSPVVSGNRATLSWTNGSDGTETPTNSLSYNLMIENVGTGEIIQSSHADIGDGFLRQVYKGNVGQNLSHTIKNLTAADYNWSVQTIDMGGIGSNFATLGSFTISNSNSVTPAIKQSISPGEDGTVLTVSEVGGFSSRDWAYSTIHGGPLTSLGVSTTTYTPNFSEPGNYYVVCKSFTGTDTAFSNEVLISALYFEETELADLGTKDLRNIQIADFDNDDDYDILTTGDQENDVNIIYENNSGTFLAYVDTLPALTSSSAACFDYNNDGYIDILICGELTTDIFNTSLFKNNGGFSFTSVFDFEGAELKGGSIDHGDIDNDGLQDIIICGIDKNSEPTTKVFRNIGNDEFLDIGAVITPLANGSVNLIDLNNDGFVDIFQSGNDLSGNPSSDYYINDQNGNFNPSGVSFQDFNSSAVDFGDYNNDGFFDILITGFVPDGFSDYAYTYVYKNINGSDFEDLLILAKNSGYNSGKWIDYDNDGYLDILLASDKSVRKNSSAVYTENLIMENQGSDVFTENPDFSFQMNYRSSSAFKMYPYDNDTDMDFLQLVYDNTAAAFKAVLFENLSPDTKSSPAVPTEMKSENSGNSVILSWKDNTLETDPAVSFNLTLYATSDTLVSSHAKLSTGYRKIAEFGEIHDTSWSITGLDLGPHTWNVQAIDNSMNTSAFSDDAFVVIEDLFQYSLVNPFPYMYRSGVDWGDYDNDGDLDLALAGSLSGGGIVSKIYKNTVGNDFIELASPLTGISGPPGMMVEWIDVNNDNNLELVLFGAVALNDPELWIYKQDGVDNFVAAYTYDHASSTGYATYGDIDNDGDIDFIIGSGKILINNGNFSFTERNESAVSGPYLDVVDIDNDLDFDIASIRFNGGNLIMNDGGTFSTIWNLLPELNYWGETKWFDYNNDSYIDLLMTGESEDYLITKVFTNNHDTTFSEVNAVLKGSERGNLAIGDYENDGDTDFYIQGKNTLEFGELYLNDNYNGFTPLDYDFINGYQGRARMGDFDNDGDLDILSTGYNDNSITTLFENTRNWTNHPPEPPDSLRYSRVGEGVVFEWNEATDVESNDGGLSYNVRIGTTAGGFDIVSPEADIGTGNRKVAKIGNAQFNTGYKLESLPVGTYYWSVQAIDHSFKGGVWAPEQIITLSNINPDFSNNDACLGTGTEFSDLSVAIGVAISHWDWDFGDGNTSTDQNPTHQFAAAGDYEVKLVASYMDEGVKTPGDSITKTVSVLPIIESDFSANTACFGELTTFTNTSVPNGLSATNWFWDFDDGSSSSSENPTNGYLASGDYYVQLKVTASNGCLDSVSNLVQVGAIPETAVTADGPLSFCDGDSVTLSVPYNLSYSYQWELSSTPISGEDSCDIVAKSSGSYTVEVVNPVGSCSSTSSAKIVTVNTAPTSPSISSSEATTFCNGDSTILSVPYNADYSYQWLLNGGAVGTDDNSYVARTDGDFTVNVTNLSGCESLSANTISVTVNAVPTIPTVSLSGTSTFCDGESIDLSVSNDPAMDYQWMDGEISIGGETNNLYSANSTGSYKLKITNSNLCVSETQSIDVTVNETPASPTISLSGATEFCDGESITLSVTNDPALTYEWLLNSGTVGADLNEYTAAVSGSYELRTSNADGCTAMSTNTVDVTVNSVPDVPSVTVAGATTFCDGNTVELSVTNDVTLSYQWVDGSTNIADAITNVYNAATTGSYKLVVENADLCSSESIPIDVTVNETPTSPTISLSGATEFCDGESITLSVTNDPALTYEWLLNSGTVGADLNEYTAAVSGSYELRTSNADGCTAMSTNTVDVTVNSVPDVPSVTVAGATTFCDGNTVELSVTNDVTLSYQWVDGSTNIADAITNVYNAATTGSYKLLVINADACYSESPVIDITVNPTPNAPIISYSGAEEFCAGESLALSITEVAGVSYQWWQDAGSVGADQNTYSATGTGSYTVDVTNAFGCISTSVNSVDITVEEKPAVPIVSVIGPMEFCHGGSVDLSVESDPAVTYQWMDGAITIDGETSNNMTATESGDYKLVLTNSTGCLSETQVVPVNVLPQPASPTITLTGPDTFCDRDTVELSAPFDSNNEYLWMLDGFHIGNSSGTLNATRSGSYSLTVRNSSFCSAISTNTVVLTVNSLPEHPAVSMNGEREFCSGLTTELSVSEDPALTYQWMDGPSNIAGETSNSIVIGSSGDYSIEVTNASGCSRVSEISNILVLESPISPTISVSGETTVCNGDTVELSVSSIDDVTYQWLLGGGSVGADMNKLSATTSGTYSLQLVNAMNCKTRSTNTVDITVNPTPTIPSVNVTDVTFFCEPNTVDIIVENDPAMTYQWMNGDAIIEGETGTTITASSTGLYKLAVTNSFACVSYTSEVPVEVSPSPQAPAITASGPLSFCVNDSVVLTVLDNPEYSYQWWHNGGGGIGGNINTYIVKGTGDYTVEAINSDGCKTLSNEITVTVHENPFKPSIANGGPTDFCDTDSVYLNIAGADPTMNYQWKNGDITLSGEESSEYYANETGSYSIVVSNSNGCSVETEALAVNVTTSPVKPTISASGITEFCEGDNVELSVTNDPSLTYRWYLSGGSVGNDTNTYTATSTGNYSLEISTVDGCATTATNTVDVTAHENPDVPSMNTSGSTTFCEGDSVLFSVENDPALSYQWTQNGFNMAGENSVALQAKASGDYKLLVSNSAGCSVETQEINVDVTQSPQMPTITLSGSDEVFCEGIDAVLSVPELTDHTYSWLRNGIASGEVSNTLRLTESGNYSLEITNDSECSSISTNTIAITVNPSPAVPAINVTGETVFCFGDSVRLHVEENSDLNYQWTRNDLNIAGRNSGTILAKTSGDYKLKLTNTYGCSTVTTDIQVTAKPSPSAPTIALRGESEFCEGNTSTLSVADNPDFDYIWKINGGDYATGSSSIQVSSSGTYSLLVTDTSECATESVNSIDIVVNEAPDIPTIKPSGPTEFCEGESLTLSINQTASFTYQWMDGFGPLSGETGNSLLITETGQYFLRISNDGECGATTDTLDIVVNTIPEKPIIDPGDYTIDMCLSADPIQLSVSNSDLNFDYQWSRNGVNIEGAVQESYEGILDEGDYRVEAGNSGCSEKSDVLTIQYGDMPERPEIIAEGPNYWYLACTNDSASAYKWYFNDTEIDGANEYLYLAGVQLGKYEVSISENGSCYNISDPVFIPGGSTGIEEDPWAGLKIYPNPTPGRFTLEMDNSIMGELIIDIFGETGKQIINIKFLKETRRFQTQIDLSGQPAAIYLIGLMLEEHKTTRSLIVE